MENYRDPIEDYTEIQIADISFAEWLRNMRPDLNDRNYLSWWLLCLCVGYHAAFPTHYFTESDEELLLLLVELSHPATFYLFPQESLHLIYFYAIGTYGNTPRVQTYHDIVSHAVDQIGELNSQDAQELEQANGNPQIDLRFPNRDHLVLPMPPPDFFYN